MDGVSRGCVCPTVHQEEAKVRAERIARNA